MTDNGSANSSEVVSPEAAPEAAPAGKSPRRRYGSSTAAPAPKPPFAFQAAKIAFWAPFVGIGLGLLSYMLNSSASNAGDVAMQRDIAFFVVGTELILMLLTLFMGAVALLAVRKHGKKSLLFRPLIGMTIATTILAIFGYAIYAHLSQPAWTMRQAASDVLGEWESESKAGNATLHVHLTFRADGTGNWKVGGTPPLEVPGKWRIERNDSRQQLILLLKFDTPLERPIKAEGIHWSLGKRTENELTLINTAPDGRVVMQTFKRVK